jgi:outer membrane cobalamin receptor
MRSSVSVLVAVAALVSVTACHGANTWDAPAPSRNVITRAEIEGSRANTAWDAVVKLRGNFMASRGANSLLVKVNKEPTVYLDDVEYGNLGTLKQIPATTVAEIRFIEGWNAETKYGPGHAAGVIQVFTRVQ